MTEPGVLMKAPGERFGERVFFCADGQRHWVRRGAWLDQHGFAWGDVRTVETPLLGAFRPARAAPCRWPDADRAEPPTADPLDLREILTARLHGTGIEFGAGAMPLPVPLECRVRYADLYTIEQLRAGSYDGQHPDDLVPPDLCASFERLDGITDGSLDFLAACHVIEHTTDPVGTLVRAAAKLRPGGSIALVVPDKTRTFDRDRPVTPLDHLVADYEHPSRLRDQSDFQEFYRLAHPAPPHRFEQVWRARWEQAFPIHYHTWTHASFGRMVQWIQARTGLFQSVWSHQPDGSGGAIEFYYLLTL